MAQLSNKAHLEALSENERYVLEALSIFNRTVPISAILYLLNPYIPTLEDTIIQEILVDLDEYYGIEIDTVTSQITVQNTGFLDYVYGQLPNENAETGYDRQTLERRAADFYSQLYRPRDIADIEPQIFEFEHRVKASDYDKATKILSDVGQDYLLTWGNIDRLLEMCQQLENNVSDQRLKGDISFVIGLAKNVLGNYADAEQYLKASIQVAKEIQDRAAEGKRLGILGNVYANLGQTQQAIQHFEQELTIAQEIGNQRIEARALGNLGISYGKLGNYSQAIETYQQALDIIEQLDDKFMQGVYADNMGEAFAHLGNYQQSMELHQQALNLAREINNRRGEAFRLANLGSVNYALGNYDQAIRHFEQGLDITREIGLRVIEDDMLAGIGKCQLALGLDDEAIKTLEQAVVIANEIERSEDQQLQGTVLAEAYLHLNRLEEALTAITNAYKTDDVYYHNHHTIVVRGVIYTRLERSEQARLAFFEALDLANELLQKTPEYYSAKYTRGLALAGLAMFASNSAQIGYLERSEEAYRAALENCNEAGVIADAKRLLNDLSSLVTLHKIFL